MASRTTPDPRVETPSAQERAAEQARRGNGDELHQQAGGSHPPIATNQGVSISDNQNSLRATPRGPTLLEDFILRDKITHFDHERIPERIVHARGTAAHGEFLLSKSLSDHTTAQVLSEVGVPVPVFCRFSAVVGGAGSMDTPRDVRGFAVKLYTQQGNWDLVGNNVPVFFIQDALKFPDLVHSVKMEPDRGFPQAAGAHDTFWDFISLMPESMHAIMWLMSDRAIPRSLRFMEGFGVHSFRLVDRQGDSTFVKFHWRPVLGMQSTLWDEAVKIAGADADYHRRDLFEAIQAGNCPAWDLAVQLFTQEQADDFPFDHLDATKLIPEELVPLQVVGRMTLNRWPDNFFAETEQVAFCPSHLVPGIDFSNDPLLQGRLFSYQDTQLSRLGSPNFHQLPINAPKCPFANFQRDAHMQHQVPTGRVNYEPNTLSADGPREAASGFHSFAERLATGGGADTAKGRIRAESFADHYSQARQYLRSLNETEVTHVASALVFELSKVETPTIRERVVAHLRVIDEALAQRVGKALGLPELPKAAPHALPPLDLPPSPKLSLIDNMKPTLQGRCVALLVDDGTDASEFHNLKAAVEADGAAVKVIAPRIGGAKLAGAEHVPADGQLAGSPSVLFDAIGVILGEEAVARLAKDAAFAGFLRDAYAHLKAMAIGEHVKPLLKDMGISPDNGVMDATDTARFVAQARTRQWAREARVHKLP